ncbi:MAG: response regulator [Bryobacteraceae bacterium]
MARASILLVDDEPSLVRLLETFLKQRDFEVDACLGSAEALEKFAAAPERYGLLIADVNMPGIPGDELALRIAGLSDSVRILLTSGLPFSTERFPAGVRARAAFLQKPFLPRMMVEAVDGLLGHE